MMRKAPLLLAALLLAPTSAFSAEKDIEKERVAAGAMFTGEAARPDAPQALLPSAGPASPAALSSGRPSGSQAVSSVPPPQAPGAPSASKGGLRRLFGLAAAALLAVGLLTGCGQGLRPQFQLNPCQVSSAAVTKTIYAVSSASTAARVTKTLIKHMAPEWDGMPDQLYYRMVQEAFARNHEAHLAVDYASKVAADCGPEAVEAIESAKEALAQTDAAFNATARAYDMALTRSYDPAHQEWAYNELKPALEFAQKSHEVSQDLEQAAAKIPPK